MAIANVQSNKASSAGAVLTLSVAFSGNVTAGNLIFAAVGYSSSSISDPQHQLAVTDSQGVQLQYLGSILFSAAGLALFSGTVASTAADTVTVQAFVSTTYSIIVSEYSGVGAAVVSALSTASSGSNTVVVPTIATNSGDLTLVVGSSSANAQTFSFSPADYTIRQTAASSQCMFLSDAFPSGTSIGGETCTKTSASFGFTVLIVNLRPITGTGVHLSQVAVETLITGTPNVRFTQIAIEVVKPYINPASTTIQQFILPT